MSDKTDETKLDLKELKLDKIPEWIQGSKEDVKRIIKDVVENLDSKNYTANVGGTNYNLKEAEIFCWIYLPKTLMRTWQTNCIRI